MNSTFGMDKLKNIFLHSMDVRFAPTEDVVLNHWPGSYIRNSLLCFSQQIEVEKDKTLLDIINEIPITETHPLYKELSGGFPKGYTLSSVLINNRFSSSVFLKKNHIYNFSICLIGKMARYYVYFIEAIKQMCIRGIGTPVVPLQLMDISETHPFHSPRLLYAGGTDTVNPLTLPVTPDDYRQIDVYDKAEVTIQFVTPVNLVQNRKKKNQQISFQDKQNGFPSFYQFTRSVVYKLAKYVVLYGETEEECWNEEVQEALDKWLLEAAEPVLTSAGLRRVTVKNTPKKEEDSIIIFRGYAGSMRYYGSFEKYLWLLLFARELGVGNDVTYGMGQYRIK